MQTASLLINKLNLKYPLVAFYDAPSKELFPDLTEPVPGRRACLFMYFNQWQKGKTLCLSDDNYGCGGCGRWWFGKETRSHEDFIRFLAEEEGLKDSFKKMEQWVIKNRMYQPVNPFIFIGPYRPELNQFAKTITFWVNADQLSILMLAAHYFNEAGSPPPVMVPFGSGCMQALTLFEDLDQPQAIIGAMDLAMRQYLPPEIFAFTVTLPMFDLLNKIDEKSFIEKPFLSTLIKARGGSLS